MRAVARHPPLVGACEVAGAFEAGEGLTRAHGYMT
jgi:hypothetical protein